ncbi:MAG: exo-alpha-sialidase [Bryobacterales bacterium]|nr:exo-alpha-sialidase [Bryobacterales bacterium]
MFSLVVGMMLAMNVGPIAPDAPAHEPQMAANGSMVALTFGAANAIYFSASHDSGATFSAPVKVAGGAIVPLTRHRGPRIALSKGAIVISAVVGRTPAEGAHAHGLPSDGDLMVWRSVDAGKSWSKGMTINDVPGAPTEGLHSLASDGKGGLFAAWLDKRGGKGTSLYGSRSSDGGLTWSKNVSIYQSPDGTICQCCHPSVAIDSGGRILVMWRNVLAGSRDMYLARSRDGVNFSKAEKLGTGTWQLNACPMDGGGVVVTQNRVITAWRREHEIFLATPGEKEVGVAEGVDVSIAAAANGVYAIWSTPTGVRALQPGNKEPIALAPKGAFPNIVTLRNGSALAAWEDDGKIQIQPVP